MLDQSASHSAAARIDGAWSHLGRALRAPDAALLRWRRRVARAHSHPLRAYHTLDHLDFLAGEIERHDSLIASPERLIAAALFHDFVYRSWRKDNEARSADVASEALADFGAPGPLIPAVHRLILRTAGHAPPLETEPDDRLFLDMDLAILGAPAETCDAYARAVRREHFWAMPGRYRAGRRAFLKAMLARPRVFNTDVYEFERGGQARANMTREIKALA